MPFHVRAILFWFFFLWKPFHEPDGLSLFILAYFLSLPGVAPKTTPAPVKTTTPKPTTVAPKTPSPNTTPKQPVVSTEKPSKVTTESIAANVTESVPINKEHQEGVGHVAIIVIAVVFILAILIGGVSVLWMYLWMWYAWSWERGEWDRAAFMMWCLLVVERISWIRCKCPLQDCLCFYSYKQLICLIFAQLFLVNLMNLFNVYLALSSELDDYFCMWTMHRFLSWYRYWRACELFFLQVGVFVYRRHRSRNIKSMNFDNPVYRKTTMEDDKVYMEKSSSRQHLPSVRDHFICIHGV